MVLPSFLVLLMQRDLAGIVGVTKTVAVVPDSQRNIGVTSSGFHAPDHRERIPSLELTAWG